MKNQVKSSQDNKLCPSYLPKSGAQLYGVISSGGFTDYLAATLEVTEKFVEEASKGRSLDKRFRFAGNCAKSGCKQWANKKCGLVGDLINLIDNEVPSTLQACPIRKDCRWYYQRQAKACAQCTEVIRNIETLALDQVEV